MIKYHLLEDAKHLTSSADNTRRVVAPLEDVSLPIPIFIKRDLDKFLGLFFVCKLFLNNHQQEWGQSIITDRQSLKGQQPASALHVGGSFERIIYRLQTKIIQLFVVLPILLKI